MLMLINDCIIDSQNRTEIIIIPLFLSRTLTEATMYSVSVSNSSGTNHRKRKPEYDTQQQNEKDFAKLKDYSEDKVTRDRDIFDKWCRFWGVIYKDEKEKAYRFRNFQKALKPPPKEKLTSHNYPGLADRTQEELDGRNAYMFQHDIDSMIKSLERFAKLRKDSAGQKYINIHSDPKVASLSDREIFDKWCQIWEVTYTGQKEREYRFRIFRKALRPSKTPTAVCPNFPNLADRTKGELNGISAYVFDFDIDGMFDDPAYNTK